MFIIGGQKQANRVSKMIANTTSKISKLYNKYKSSFDNQSCFTVNDVCNLQSSFWINPDHSDYTRRGPSNVPANIQRRVIEQHNLVCRAHEEQQLVISDAVKIVLALEKKLYDINNNIAQLLSEDSDVSLDPTEEDMIHNLGPTDCLSLFKRGKLSAFINHAKQTAMRLGRIRDTLVYLSYAYHNEDDCQKEHLRTARCYGQAMLLPSIFLWSDTIPIMHSAAAVAPESELDISSSSCESMSSMTLYDDSDFESL